MPNVFIDASGNAGLRTQRNESNMYVVCAVFMGNDFANQALEEAHTAFMRLQPATCKECKYSENRRRSHEYIKNAIGASDWCYAATIGYKDQLLTKRLSRAASCQHWFLKRALLLKRKALEDGLVIIDRGASSRDDLNLLNALKEDSILGTYSAVQLSQCEDSRTSYGIQLADAIAGTLNRISRVPDTDVLNVYSLLRERETVLWRYPFDASQQKDEGLKPLAFQMKLEL